MGSMAQDFFGMRFVPGPHPPILSQSNGISGRVKLTSTADIGWRRNNGSVLVASDTSSSSLSYHMYVILSYSHCDICFKKWNEYRDLMYVISPVESFNVSLPQQILREVGEVVQ